MRDIALMLAGASAAAFAVLMLVQRTLYSSAICLLVVLLQLAAMFYLLGAPLLGFLQVLVYAGAIMVMIVVAIMATPPKLRRLWSDGGIPWPAAWLLLAAVLAQFLGFALPEGGAAAPWPTMNADVGAALFGPYALLTEALGLLVLVASLAVVEVWKEEA